MTRKRASRVVERVTVGVRTCFLEEWWIVLGPRAAVTSGWGGVDTLAAITVRVEQRTGALARHHTGAIGRLDGQFVRTLAVQVGNTVSRLAVDAVFRCHWIFVRHNLDRQVKSVH